MNKKIKFTLITVSISLILSSKVTYTMKRIGGEAIKTTKIILGTGTTLAAMYLSGSLHKLQEQRLNEFDADKKAALALGNAKSGIKNLTRLLDDDANEDNFSYFKSHPKVKDRILYLICIQKQLDQKQVQPFKDIDEKLWAKLMNLSLDKKVLALHLKARKLTNQFNWPNQEQPEFSIGITNDPKRLAFNVRILDLIILNQNILNFPQDEIEFILSHEIAHSVQFKDKEEKEFVLHQS